MAGSYGSYARFRSFVSFWITFAENHTPFRLRTVQHDNVFGGMHVGEIPTCEDAMAREEFPIPAA